MSLGHKIGIAVTSWMLGILPACGDASDVAYNDKTTDLGANSVQSAIASLSAKVSGLEIQLAAAQASIVAHEERVATLEAVTAVQHEALAAAVAALESKTAAISAEIVDGQAAVIFNGVNVHVRNGLGATATLNGVGNLIVGYNEHSNEEQSGSHNIILGDSHEYSSYGGLVAGRNNRIAGPFATVCGGLMNESIGEAAAILGGGGNVASGRYSSISGGDANSSAHEGSSVSGGRYRATLGDYNWVGGGLWQNE